VSCRPVREILQCSLVDKGSLSKTLPELMTYRAEMIARRFLGRQLPSCLARNDDRTQFPDSVGAICRAIQALLQVHKGQK
jgi:hypothetical protein